MRLKHILVLLFAPAAFAQQVVAPTGAPVGAGRGENVGGYNITNSFELGYRFRDVHGDLGKYRSDVNFGNGIRLLSSSLAVYSREGHGKYFDELLINTQGLGNDPYQLSNLRVQKNKLYRYDLLWRLSDYYNPAQEISLGRHLENTQRRLQDHDLVLFPQSSVRFFLGYTRNSQDGAALATVLFVGQRGDEFPLFSNIRRLRNEFRVGNEINYAGFRFSWMRGWDNFKDDTPLFLTAPSTGSIPDDGTDLTRFSRVEPYHGNAPYWRLNLFTERSLWSVSARYTWAEAKRNFIQDEVVTGAERFGAERTRQVVLAGTGRRPVSAGNLTVNLFPLKRLTFTNHTAFYSRRMEGDGLYQEFNNATADFDLFYFRQFGIRSITNQSELTFRLTDRAGLFGGYNYSNRRIRSQEVDESGGIPDAIGGDQKNRLHSGVAGVRLQPLNGLHVNLDAEIGRADRPFFPIGDRNYHALGARVQYRIRNLMLSGLTRTFYNTNSISLSVHSSRSRTYSFDASWSPWAWFGFDAGYSKLHLDAMTGIAYFAQSQLISGDRSLYFSNVHSANLGVRAAIRNRVDVYAGYTRVQDTGDGRDTLIGAGAGSSLTAFQAVQTFPLTYESPLARISVRLHNKLRWNFGYQFYHYDERFLLGRLYDAHTGYTSLSWSF